MRHRGVVKLDALTVAEVLEFFGGEVRSVVGDDAMRYAETENDGPDKVDNRGSHCICDRDSFYPLCELVHGHQKVCVRRGQISLVARPYRVPIEQTARPGVLSSILKRVRVAWWRTSGTQCIA